MSQDNGRKRRQERAKLRTQNFVDTQEAREVIRELGGETFLPNLLRSYVGREGPKMQTITDRAGNKREQFVPGFELKSSLPDNLEPGIYVILLPLVN